MKVRAVVKLPDGRTVEVVAEPEMFAYISLTVPLENLEVISIEVVEA